MRTYIAGPITGVDNYAEPFNDMQQELEQQGHKVMNPAILPEGFEWEQYMPICFAMIDACDVVVFLPGWENSKGAKRELEYAELCGKLIRK